MCMSVRLYVHYNNNNNIPSITQNGTLKRQYRIIQRLQTYAHDIYGKRTAKRAVLLLATSIATAFAAIHSISNGKHPVVWAFFSVQLCAVCCVMCVHLPILFAFSLSSFAQRALIF